MMSHAHLARWASILLAALVAFPTLHAEQLAGKPADVTAQVEALKRELAAPPAEVGSELGPEAPLAEVEAQLAHWTAALEDGRSELAERQDRIDQRSTRLPALAAEISQGERRIEELEGASRGTPLGPEHESELEALQAQVATLRAERDDLEAQRELLPLLRDRAQRRIAEAERAVAFWQEQVREKREQETQAATREARLKRKEIAESFPQLSELAARNEELAKLRSGLTQRLARARRELTESERLLQRIEEHHRTTRRRIASGGFTEGMGRILRRDFEWLPTEDSLRAGASERGERLSRAQYELIEVEEERSQVGDLGAAATRFRSAAQDEPLTSHALELLEAQRHLHDALIEDLDQLTALLQRGVQVDVALRRSASAYRADVEGLVFWVRSSAANPLPSFAALPQHLLELSDSISWEEARGDVRTSLLHSALGAGLLTVLVATLTLGRRFLKRKRAEMADLVRSHRTDRFLYTVRALIQTLLIALPMPLAFWGLGWLLSSASAEIVRALGEGLRETAWNFLELEYLRQVAKPKGLGEGHFRWPGRSMASLRAELNWFEPLTVALGLVVSTFSRQSVLAWSDSIGRTAFILEMAALALLLHRLVRPGSDLFSEAFQSSKGLLGRTHVWWSGLAIGVPSVLILLALAGYYYTATQLEYRLRYSIALAIGLVLVNAILLRWLFVARRRLAVAQAREKAKTRGEVVESEPEGARESGTMPGPDEDRIDIPAVDAQTRQLIRSGVTLATVVGLYFIWSTALPALAGLDSVQLWPRFAIIRVEPGSAISAPAEAAVAPEAAEPRQATSMYPLPATEGGQAEPDARPVVLTLADVSLALIVLLLTIVAAKNVPGVLEISLLQRLPLDTGSRYAVSTIVRYVILIFGTSATLTAMGLGWEKIQWLAAALTFGLAFGLQEIFANFVSGIIILLERPVRLGDIVTVAGTEGRVTRLRMRATTIQDWDRREFLVPNKEFITGSVINWTLSDPITRIVVPVGIAYGSDTELARRLLLSTAEANPLVLDEPAPSAIFRRFGESSLDFELRVFMGSRDLWPEVVHRLHTEIDRAFREAGIEIAFPQRDLHVRSAEGLTAAGLAPGGLEQAEREPPPSAE